METLLSIKKNGNFYIEDGLVSTDNVENINEYLMQLLGFYVTIDEGVKVEELVHGLYGLREFIKGYFSEEYEVIRAFAGATKLDKKYKAIRLYKKMVIESDEFLSDEEFVYILPEIEFVESNEDEWGSDKLGLLPVVIDSNIELKHNDVNLKLKTKFTLMDILTCIFDEMSHCIKGGVVVTAE